MILDRCTKGPCPQHGMVKSHVTSRWSQSFKCSPLFQWAVHYYQRHLPGQPNIILYRHTVQKVNLLRIYYSQSNSKPHLLPSHTTCEKCPSLARLFHNVCKNIYTDLKFDNTAWPNSTRFTLSLTLVNSNSESQHAQRTEDRLTYKCSKEGV